MREKQGDMLCPGCGRPMARGRLCSPEERGIYWLPDTVEIGDLGGWVLTEGKIQAAGGVVLDRLRRVGFFAKDRPDSYYCKDCGAFLTLWEAETEDGG